MSAGPKPCPAHAGMNHLLIEVEQKNLEAGPANAGMNSQAAPSLEGAFLIRAPNVALRHLQLGAGRLVRSCWFLMLFSQNPTKLIRPLS